MRLPPPSKSRFGYGIPLAAERRPGWLTKEELDSIARFVRFAQQRKAAHESAEEETNNGRE